MSTLRVFVEGVGLWSPQLADFAALQAVLRGDTPTPPGARPTASALPPNERRRAPPSVLLAVEVAGQAVAMSNREPASLPCVFASSHGDQPITDYMCATLAQAPTQLSPTRFHNSVHNAAVGYWTMATGCHAASTAIAAQRASFGAGLLEAACQVVTTKAPVLMACSDTAGAGPLLEVTGCEQPFGSALVLAAERSSRASAQIDLRLGGAFAPDALAEPLATWCASNASAAGMPLLARLAGGGGRCTLEAAEGLALEIDLEQLA